LADKYLNYIGGRWVPAESGEFFENRNPADTSDCVGLFPKSSTADVDRAVKAAEAAYDAWRLTPAPRRGEALMRLGQPPRPAQGGACPAHDPGNGRGGVAAGEPQC